MDRERKKILVVEDDNSVRELLHMLIDGEDCEVLEAKDGLEGLLKAEFVRPDLIILDLMMPDIEGERVLNQLRQEPKLAQIPVLIVTGKYEAIDRCKDLLGSENVFAKPFEPTKLLDRVNQLLGDGSE